ncbi:unnamed protein product [Arctia plantaginis]|uniref:Uncharacterized protein n=1 Tax=Arctia plantaginis TaxID=874455 RepID=A0A8S0YUE4_ARCPL|nr:unnamed protein product [Arctia plantaginis]
MEILRYKYIFLSTLLFISGTCNGNTKTSLTTTTPKCPFTKIVEDIFQVNNKTSSVDTQARNQNKERVKLFLNTIANVTNENISRKEEDLINIIIASINRIKNNIINAPEELNEAIIINPKLNNNTKKITQIKSGVEEKTDVARTKKQTTKSIEITEISTTTETPKYVEVLTIPHTKENTTSANIIEVLKHLMPLFNGTSPKEIHNVTIIEKGANNNNSFSATKNFSTIIVAYCDNNNSSEAKTTFNKTHDEKHDEDDPDEDYYVDDDVLETVEGEDDEALNITLGEKREIMEAAEYGMQKMHELYTVLEPKLYSMGLWLDDTSPARYVAAFNAPSEEAAKFSRYGYAALQAATKLKQLTRSVLFMFDRHR